MNYELAKNLKDAGFPQDGTDKWYCAHDMWGPPDFRESCDCTREKIVSLPTLSELIEACGDDFVSLVMLLPGVWLAHGETENPGEGKTTEEAVARLWLALNKK